MSENEQTAEEQTANEEVSGLEKAKATPNPGVEGWEPVDIEDPKVQQRFNRLYAQVKGSERAMAELREHNQKLAEKLESLVEQQNQAKTQAEHDALRAEFKRAADSFDGEKLAELTMKVADAKRDAPKPKKEQVYQSADDPVLAPEEVAAIQRWQTEVGSDGQPIRPWARPGHPKNGMAAGIVRAVFDDPDIASKGIDAILKEADRLMGLRDGGRSSPVLESNVTPTPRKKGTPELTPEQKAVARKMGLSEEKYAKQLKMLEV